MPQGSERPRMSPTVDSMPHSRYPEDPFPLGSAKSRVRLRPLRGVPAPHAPPRVLRRPEVALSVPVERGALCGACLFPVCVCVCVCRRGTQSAAGAMAESGAERADGRIVKMEVDYSATVDQRLPECERLAQVSGTGRPGGADGLSRGAGCARPRSGRPGMCAAAS